MGFELLRALELMVAVELALDDYKDTSSFLFANQLSQMQATSLAVVSLYIRNYGAQLLQLSLN